MDQNDADKRQHHFLYYIFKADKEANPMDGARVAGLQQILQQMIATSKKGDGP